jgi:hypothetical protein
MSREEIYKEMEEKFGLVPSMFNREPRGATHAPFQSLCSVGVRLG